MDTGLRGFEGRQVRIVLLNNLDTTTVTEARQNNWSFDINSVLTLASVDAHGVVCRPVQGQAEGASAFIPWTAIATIYLAQAQANQTKVA